MMTGGTKRQKGFTIVELLMVIVIIGILAGLVVVTYASVRDRSIRTTQNTELQQLKKAIMMARIRQDKTLGEITGSYWSLEPCLYVWSGGNTTNTVPRLLSKTGACWQAYYTVLDAIQAASGVNMQSFRKGDPNGNPYYIDESEGESHFAACSQRDSLVLFSNTNADLDFDSWDEIDFYRC